MNYPAELCRLVIRNMEIIETVPAVVTDTEKCLFKAVDERIEKAVKAKKDWEGCYDLVIDKEYEETTFGPANWLKADNGDFLAWYTLTSTEESGDYSWLSCAAGVMGAALCLEFSVDIDWSGLTPKEYKKALESFYAGNETLQSAGFCLARNKKSIVRPFTFDADKLATEYPDFDESLAPLDAALEDLFKAHSEFDKFVEKLKHLCVDN